MNKVYKFYNQFLKFLMCMLFVVASTMYADEITIHNKTKQDMYGAAYYTDGDAKRSGNIYFIKAESSLKLERPGWEFGKYREFVFDYFPQDLSNQISANLFNTMLSMDIGWTEGTEFWIAKKDGVLKTFTLVEWKVFKPIYTAFKVTGKKLLEPLFAKSRKKASQALHAKEVARVRVGTGLAPQEIAFRKKRLKKVKEGIAQLTGKQVDNEFLPIIGAAVSGGGYRAMITAASFLKTADEIGLLDSLMYVSFLSGSTWAGASWAIGDKTPAQVYENIINKAQTKLLITLSPNDFKRIVDNLLMKEAFNQAITLVDLWGLSLAQKLLSNFVPQEQIIGLSAAQKYVDDGSKPLTIQTAISNTIATEAADYKWFEFTPYEVGCPFLNASIPIWAFGRRFENGVSQDFAPEQSLGYLMGIFGSALSLNMGDIIDRIKVSDDESLNHFMKPLFNVFKINIEKARKFQIIEGGDVFNFAYGLASSPASARSQKYIEFKDAGFVMEDPVVPLLKPGRNLDIMIIISVSELSGRSDANLTRLEQYLKKHPELKFPSIDYSVSHKQNVSIFGNPSDPNQLVAIFIPYMLNKNLPKPYNTYDAKKRAGTDVSSMNMNYTPQQVDLVGGYTRESLIYIKDTIKQVIEMRIEAKRKALGIAKTVQEKLSTSFK